MEWSDGVEWNIVNLNSGVVEKWSGVERSGGLEWSGVLKCWSGVEYHTLELMRAANLQLPAFF